MAHQLRILQNHFSSRRVWGCLVVSLVSLAVCAQSRAADEYYLHSLFDMGSGLYSDPANWSGGAVPGPGDVIHFSNGVFNQIGYTVNFTADATNAALVVETDRVTFDPVLFTLPF
jgi:hypothetical protein